MASRPFSPRTVSNSQMVEDKVITGLPKVLVLEEQFVDPEGPGQSWMIAGYVSEYVIILEFESLGEKWEWNEVTSIVELQAQKILRHRSD